MHFQNVSGPEQLRALTLHGHALVTRRPTRGVQSQRSGGNAWGMQKVFYYGCWGEPGHFYFWPGMRMMFRADRARIPFGRHIDAGFLEGVPQEQGLGRLVDLNGEWTAFTFWDRTVDDRPCSNAAFLAPGRHLFGEVLDLARLHYPEVWRRVNLVSQPLRLYQGAPDDGETVLSGT